MARREGLTEAKLHGVTDLILVTKSRKQVEFVFEKPRQALRQAPDEIVRGHDLRLSMAGNRIARRLAMLLDQLPRMETSLEHDGRAQLTAFDRPILWPGLARLARDSAVMSQLAKQFVAEIGDPIKDA